MWQTREEWQALVDGVNCPMCATLRADEAVTPYNFKVATMRAGRLYLQRNQFIRGYCILMAERHVIELHELEALERVVFLEDMVHAGQTLMRVFGADKLNYELLGNGMPHLHAHIKPRYLDGPLPHNRIGQKAGELLLSEEAYQQRVQDIAAALKG
jgi:diadenosine tetraphosphate (Ap4A) HIT family hydrolase